VAYKPPLREPRFRSECRSHCRRIDSLIAHFVTRGFNPRFSRRRLPDVPPLQEILPATQGIFPRARVHERGAGGDPAAICARRTPPCSRCGGSAEQNTGCTPRRHAMFSASNEGKSHLRQGACVLRYESVLLPLLILVGLGAGAAYCPTTAIVLRSTIGSMFWTSPT
jgi:hypothetical protein